LGHQQIEESFFWELATPFPAFAFFCVLFLAFSWSFFWLIGLIAFSALFSQM
jgi:hypothetical protein